MVSATFPCLQTKWFNLLWKFTYHFTPSKLQILEYNCLVSCVQGKNLLSSLRLQLYINPPCILYIHFQNDFLSYFHVI
jgi:hypothetical protein